MIGMIGRWLPIPGCCPRTTLVTGTAFESISITCRNLIEILIYASAFPALSRPWEGVNFRMYNSSHSELLAGTPFEDVLLKPGDIMIFDASHWHEFRYTAEHEPAPSDRPTNGRYLGIYMAVVLYATLNVIPPLVTSAQVD
jgi:hypothetical protein